ncbi:MAG: hypothetical protein WAT26_07460 [Saprospiraceae bacterium]|nr:hypothetical protein [Saprospiraceae bacterium]
MVRCKINDNSREPNSFIPEWEVPKNDNSNTPFRLFIEDNVDLIQLRNHNKSYQKIKNDREQIVLEITKDNDTYKAKTGNFIGTIYHEKQIIDITCRFGDYFLQHMLNYANDIYVLDQSFSADKNDKDESQFQYILAHLFVQKLEKAASVLGFPKAYREQTHLGYNIKGQIDIQHLITHNLPLRAPIQSRYRDQIAVQEIIDVLYKATKILSKKFNRLLVSRISQSVQFMKENRSSALVTSSYIQKAKTHKALQNPLYRDFKDIIYIAEIIINNFNFSEKPKGKSETKGFLIDVSELFEIYIEKVLRKNLSNKGWQVSAQEKLSVYEGAFFGREIRPDIVLKKEEDVAVFDVKYKKMNYLGRTQNSAGDVDREDFFQIHTYMAYYNGKQEHNLKLGGLLYPIEAEYKNNKYPSMLHDKTQFIVDGIGLSNTPKESGHDEQNIVKIELKENEFIRDAEKLFSDRIFNYLYLKIQ